MGTSTVSASPHEEGRLSFSTSIGKYHTIFNTKILYNVGGFSPWYSCPLRYGQPDPYLEREYDIKVSLQMASVQYVHTQRFQAEVVAFIQHFTQLQDVLGRQRAAMEGQAVSTADYRSMMHKYDAIIPVSQHSFYKLLYDTVLSLSILFVSCFCL